MLLDDLKDVSVIKNPFTQEMITSMNIRFYSWARRGWKATINFQNGKTSGTHDTSECDTLEDVLVEVKNIIENLQK